MFRKVLLACGVLLGVCSVASATPFIGLDDPTSCPSGNSSWIGVSTTSSPISLDVNSNGGGVFCLYNAMQGLIPDGPDGGAQPITDLTLQTTATITNLGNGEGQNNAGNSYGINCQSTFFNNPTPPEGNTPGSCVVTYDANTSLLQIEFSVPRTNLDGDEGPSGNDTEAGEDEGIPQLPTGCTVPFSSESCTGQGLFFINLNTGDVFDPSGTGEWNTIGVTSMDITAVNGSALATPEPSSFGIILASMLLMGVVTMRRRARRA